jgi:hypothetical protein
MVQDSEEMQGRSALDVIEMYFRENPELKRWFERNIDSGTCGAAVAELREKKERLRQSREEQRHTLAPPVEPDPAFEWLRQAARGSAKSGTP